MIPDSPDSLDGYNGVKYTKRDLEIMLSCAEYYLHPLGLPGHVLMMLVGKAIFNNDATPEQILRALRVQIASMNDVPRETPPGQGVLPLDSK